MKKAPGVAAKCFHFRHSDKRSKISLGDFETLPASQRFDAACQTARKKFEHFDRGGSTLPLTVKQACANYVKHLADNSRQATSQHAAGRFKCWLEGTKLASVPLQKLKPGDLAEWRVKLAARPSIPQDKATRDQGARRVHAESRHGHAQGSREPVAFVRAQRPMKPDNARQRRDHDPHVSS